MIRAFLKVLLVIYAGLATYFAWQYFHEPELRNCFELPKAKLLNQDLPSAWESINSGEANQGSTEMIAGVQEKFGQTAEQAQQLAFISQQIAAELNLGENMASNGTASASESADQPGSGVTSLKNKITDFGQYMYCRQVVKKYELENQGIVQILN